MNQKPRCYKSYHHHSPTGPKRQHTADRSTRHRGGNTPSRRLPSLPFQPCFERAYHRDELACLLIIQPYLNRAGTTGQGTQSSSETFLTGRVHRFRGRGRRRTDYVAQHFVLKLAPLNVRADAAGFRGSRLVTLLATTWDTEFEGGEEGHKIWTNPSPTKETRMASMYTKNYTNNTDTHLVRVAQTMSAGSVAGRESAFNSRAPRCLNTQFISPLLA